jgi:hypothetical protein
MNPGNYDFDYHFSKERAPVRKIGDKIAAVDWDEVRTFYVF